MAETLVIAHAGCHDGFGAAWVAWKALGEVCFQFAKYGDPAPDVTGKQVYIFDFSYPRLVMEQMEKDAAGLVVRDHHRSAQSACEGLPFCEFDMERSGAGMAWDYFHPGEPRPPLIDYVEDADLYNWKLPQSRQINACLRSYPKDFLVWNQLAESISG